MYAVLALTLMLAQPAPKEKEREPALDPFIAKAVEPDAKDTPLRKLQKERGRERALAVIRFDAMIEVGRWEHLSFSDYVKLQVTLAENLAELMDKPADKVKCYEMRLGNLKTFEQFIADRVRNGSELSQHANLAKAARIEAEMDLLKLKESLKGGK